MTSRAPPTIPAAAPALTTVIASSAVRQGAAKSGDPDVAAEAKGTLSVMDRVKRELVLTSLG